MTVKHSAGCVSFVSLSWSDQTNDLDDPLGIIVMYRYTATTPLSTFLCTCCGQTLTVANLVKELFRLGVNPKSPLPREVKEKHHGQFR